MEEAEKAYEFIEENPPEIKLSVYRMRRLADKKYEFCADEEESENITPYRLAKLDSPSKTDTCRSRMLPQQATMQELYIYTSPPFSPADSDDSSKVLRPLNSNLPFFDNKSSPRSIVLAELTSPGNNRGKKESSCCTQAEKKPVSTFFFSKI
jgi:DDB1- and CUL4-associated factor 15